MTNNLSKQLCELCGIEPKIGICDRELNPNHYTKCGFENPTKFECNDCTNFYDDLVIYPDFIKPENFVKLLELLYKTAMGTGVSLWNFRNSKKSYIECFLEQTIARIKLLGSSQIGREITQAIKNTEWNYE